MKVRCARPGCNEWVVPSASPTPNVKTFCSQTCRHQFANWATTRGRKVVRMLTIDGKGMAAVAKALVEIKEEYDHMVDYGVASKEDE